MALPFYITTYEVTRTGAGNSCSITTTTKRWITQVNSKSSQQSPSWSSTRRWNGERESGVQRYGPPFRQKFQGHGSGESVKLAIAAVLRALFTHKQQTNNNGMSGRRKCDFEVVGRLKKNEEKNKRESSQ
jgi:hypothetical protein